MREPDEIALVTVDIIYAGGTITSVIASEEGYREGGHAFNLTDLRDYAGEDADIPQTGAVESPTYQVGYQDVASTGLSENMSRDLQIKIADKIVQAIDRGPAGILVTHGTDSMEQTAHYLLQTFRERLLKHGMKLVLTGANEDMYHPQTDVWENIDFALEQAAGNAAPGVYVAYHGKMIPASEVVKLPFTKGVRPTFVSNKSGEYKQAVASQAALAEKQKAKLLAAYGKKPKESVTVVYDVNVIRSNHEKFLNDIVADQSIKSVLLNLYHSGTANTDKPQQSVAELVKALRSTRKDLVFFGVTETGEPVNLHAYETSVKLRKAGVVPLYDMLRDVALLKLQLLDNEYRPKERIQEMLKSKVGEIDEINVKIHADDIKQLIQLYS